MKYLTIRLLLCSLSNAQEFKNYTKVTAYRLINESEDGPCTIIDYMDREGQVGYYIQAAQSYNDTLAYNLLRLKKETKEWPKQEYTCFPDSLVATPVSNMFVVEVNTFKDTIFTTKDLCSVFLPQEKTEYIDMQEAIRPFFTKDMAAFLERDFEGEINNIMYDSIPINSITIAKQPVYGLTREEFEQKTIPFQLVRTDSVYGSDGKRNRVLQEFWLNNMKVLFNHWKKKIDQVMVYSTDHDFPDNESLFIDGIKLGDSEEVLFERFPNSTAIRNWGAPLNDLNNYYYYEVDLSDDGGKVTFTIKNKAIIRIQVDFMYLPPKPTASSKG